MSGHPERNHINIGSTVSIETKENQGTGRLTQGTVSAILTHSNSHPHGIKVRLYDGSVGRVREVSDGESSIQPKVSYVSEGAGIIDIPNVEDKHNEFKEFYQYDGSIENVPSGQEKSKKIKEIKRTVRERFATAVCAFGNSYEGGFLYVGIKSDGTVSGMEKDMKLDGFTNYEDDLANHMRTTLGALLVNKVFLTSNINMSFKKVNEKTVCVVGA